MGEVEVEVGMEIDIDIDIEIEIEIEMCEEMTLYTQICDKHKVQVDKNKLAAMTTEMKATKGMVATSKIFNVFFSKAAKEGDPAGVRDQLLPIQ